MARKFQRGRNPALPQVGVIVGRRRALSGELALERFHSEVILLDDGFQHLQLERTLELVLIDATDPFGGEYLLPAGFLREPLKNLCRADAFLITRSDEIEDLSPIASRLRQITPHAAIFRGIHAYDEIRKIGTGEAVALEHFNHQRLLALCGLGNPTSFHRLLNTLQLQPLTHLDFPDHHRYTLKDIADIQQIIIDQQITDVITTEKDEAKLLPYLEKLKVAISIVTIRLDIQPRQQFEKFLARFLG
jgi:tetraacyldisaccharide 4'-kinase